MNVLRPLSWVRDACITMLSVLLPVYKDIQQASKLGQSGHIAAKAGVPTNCGTTNASEMDAGILRKDLPVDFFLSPWATTLLNLDRSIAHSNSLIAAEKNPTCGKRPNT